MAGVGGDWKKGRFLEDRNQVDDRHWHVVTVRSRDNPMEGLLNSISKSAQSLGLYEEACSGLRQRITPDNLPKPYSR